MSRGEGSWPAPVTALPPRPSTHTPFSCAGNVVDFGYTLNKGCSPICPGPSVNLGVASVGTHCCQSFLCNISAADGGLRASAAVLGLGLLLSLLSALLRFGP